MRTEKRAVLVACLLCGCATAGKPNAYSPFVADACPIPAAARHYQVVARADSAAISTADLNTFLRAAVSLFTPPGRRVSADIPAVERAPYSERDSIFGRG